MRKQMTMLLLAAAALCIACWSGCGKGSVEKSTPEIGWIYNVDSALALAKSEHKVLMIDFMAVWCPPCRAMEDSTFSDPAVIALASKFVTLRVDVDKKRDVAIRYGGNARKYGGIGIPNILFMTPAEKKLRHIVGFYRPDSLAAVMDSVLAMK